MASAQLTLLGLWTIHLRIGQEVDVYSGLPATMKIVRHYLTVECMQWYAGLVNWYTQQLYAARYTLIHVHRTSQSIGIYTADGCCSRYTPIHVPHTSQLIDSGTDSQLVYTQQMDAALVTHPFMSTTLLNR